MLGGLEADWDGDPVELPRSRHVQSLLAWLVLDPRPHARSRVASRFWPDVLDSSARASLRSAVWALRAALGDRADLVLAVDRTTVGIRPEAVAVDVREFERLLDRGEAEAAVGLCRGELLAEFDDDWVFEARDAHLRLLDGALEHLARRAEARGDSRGAVDWSRRRTIRSPLDQAAARALIERLAAAGDLPGALEAYERLDARLRLTLGIGPDPETRALVRGLRGAAGDVDGELTRPPRRPPPRRGGRERAPLVGREPERDRLDQALERAAQGLAGIVTITGEGGIGKTRLLEDVLARALGRGFTAASAAGVVIATGEPFAVWAELVDGVAEQVELPAGAPPWWVEALGRLAPTLGRATSAAGPPRVRTEPGLERLRLFEATTALITTLATTRPVLLVIDDLHLVDSSSLELLAHVGRRARGLPLLIVVGHRERSGPSELDATMASLRASGLAAEAIALGPLAPPVVRQLAQAAGGPGPLGDRELGQIVEVAGGNPLLALELARSTTVEGGAPAGLASAARLALGRLDGEARGLVELLAIAGGEVGVPELHGPEPPSTTPVAIEAAIGSGLVDARGTGLRIRHALIAEAVREQIPATVRIGLHGELGGGAPPPTRGAARRRDRPPPPRGRATP